ncbi:MAG TPA: hypothetical protein VFQ34_13390 [Nitrospiraceae bacterium]|jgi:hypothetical protein|nr:hypothetical protein [Nitrospiraceae bacterium]
MLGRHVSLPFVLLALLFVSAMVPNPSLGQPMDEFSATTEKTCGFGMAEGQPSNQCEVPIPSGCSVANFPGTTKPWITVSKAGKTFCRFDPKSTDWKARITGTCSRCESSHCTGQFSVRFDCAKRP